MPRSEVTDIDTILDDFISRKIDYDACLKKLSAQLWITAAISFAVGLISGYVLRW